MIYSSVKQRQMIGFLRKKLNIDDETYYEIIAGYSVKSSKELSYFDAENLLKKLKSIGVDAGVYQYRNYNKYDNLSARKGMATPAQLKKINIMWKNVSFLKTEDAKERALNSFIAKITSKQRVNFLTQSDVKKVIKALEVMQAKKNKEKVKNG